MPVVPPLFGTRQADSRMVPGREPETQPRGWVHMVTRTVDGASSHLDRNQYPNLVANIIAYRLIGSERCDKRGQNNASGAQNKAGLRCRRRLNNALPRPDRDRAFASLSISCRIVNPSKGIRTWFWEGYCSRKCPLATGTNHKQLEAAFAYQRKRISPNLAEIWYRAGRGPRPPPGSDADLAAIWGSVPEMPLL
jgi:hypothetical protein